MKSYSSYKDSGVEWIEEIPCGWEVGKLNHITSKITNGYVGPTRDVMNESGVRYIQGIHIKNGKIIYTPDGPYYVSEEWSIDHQKSILKEGDVLVVQTGTIGEVGYVTEEFEDCNCHALIIIQLKSEYGIGKYLTYFIMSNYVKNFFRTIKTGEILEHLNTTKVRYMKICLPPLPEQKQIVSFLDTKTQKIDELIEKTGKRIELLKEKRTSLINHCVTKGLNPNVEMKDSGVEWIGEIPKDWTTVKLKYTINPTRKITYGIVQPGEFDSNGRYMIRGQDYSFGWVDESNVFRVSEKIELPYKRSRIKTNDIVFTIVGGIGNVGLVPEKYDGSNLTQTTGRLSFNENYLSKYIFYILQSEIKTIQIGLKRRGSVIPGINLGDLENFILPVSKNNVEQTQIVDYLDEQTQKIDSTIEKEAQRIELLKEYRQSLISEVVTGKIDVRNEVVV